MRDIVDLYAELSSGWAALVACLLFVVALGLGIWDNRFRRYSRYPSTG